MIGQPIAALDTPVLALDLEAMARNIAIMRRIIVEEAGIRWRPHTKAIKIPAIAHLLLKAGAFGVTCAKLGEAEVMAAAGIPDILIANQVVTPAKISRLVHLRRQADVVVAVDDAANVRALDEAARRAGVRQRVVIEVDMGMRRCGVAPGEAVVALARRIAACEGLAFAGLMGWEGHTPGIPDPAAKRKAVTEAVALITDSARLCKAAGLPAGIVSCGGTGTYWITAALPGVTEVQAGGGIFGDLHYRRDFGVAHEPALALWTTVISRPSPTRLVCDAGWKAMGRQPHPPEPLGLTNVVEVDFSAEHVTVECAEPIRDVAVGSPLAFDVGYSDSTVFLHDIVYGVRNGIVEAAWPVLGRGRLS
jgi:D-serine deaminase-like pyridoxal phosphate-dependent protein